jgi:regulatory protein
MARRTRRAAEPQEKCADAAKARTRALDYLAAREHASGELYERLCRGFTEEAAAAAVADMVELDYVNDARYARTKANSLLHARKSRRAAADALSRKGISKQDAADALDAVYAPEDGEDPELEAVRALVERSYRRKLEEGRKDLVVAALLRRGFRYATVKEALRAVEEGETFPADF